MRGKCYCISGQIDRIFNIAEPEYLQFVTFCKFLDKKDGNMIIISTEKCIFASDE